MLRLLFIVFFSLTATVLTAQTTFKKRFGTSGADRAWYVEVLSDNSFLVAGSSTDGGLGGDDATLVKLSADGTVEWSKAYGGSNYDRFGRIFSCSDGNYLAIGETNSMGAGGVDIYVVKVDVNGNVLWERTCGGGGSEGLRGVCEVSDGYIVTGATLSCGSGGYDIFVTKLDFDGTSLWSKAWGTASTDNAGDPIPAAGGDVWVSGYVNIASNNDGILMRISSNGTLISANRTGGSASENMLYLTIGGPGLGQSGSSWNGSTQFQPWLYGHNSSGVFLWAKRYLIPSGDYDMKAEGCPDGGFVFTPYNLNSYAPDAYLVKTDGGGNIAWAKSHSFNGSGRMAHIRPVLDGGYVAVGFCTGAGGYDYFVIKTDASGNVEGCCPVDASITAEVINPTTTTTSLGNVDCTAAAAAVGQEEFFNLNEVSMCNGPSCCVTDAGTMLVQTLNVCINQPATFTHNGDEVLDANDLLQFILFSDLNDTLGSIIAISNTPTFNFDPATMSTGVTYYIAAIAGDNLGGNVDLNDPCLDISNVAMLIWQPLPTVTFSVANPDVCAGQCTTVTATFTGAPPFTLTYTTPGTGSSTQTFPGFSGTFQVCAPPGTPPGSFVLQATTLTDAYCTCN